MSVKWCPNCGSLNPKEADKCDNRQCRRVFTGEELGAPQARTTVRIESRVLNPTEVGGHLALIGEQEPERRGIGSDDLKVFARNAGLAALIGLSGIGFIALGRGMGFPLAILVGAGASIAGTIGIIASLVWLVRLPRFKTADEVAECFWGQLVKGPDIGGSASRAWSCLDRKAQNEFGSLAKFRDHWKTRQQELQGWAIRRTSDLLARRPSGKGGAPKCMVLKSSLNVKEVNESVAEARVEILLWVYEQVDVGKSATGVPIFESVGYADLVLPQSKTLLKANGRWYLTSGTLDSPLDAVAGPPDIALEPSAQAKL